MYFYGEDLYHRLMAALPVVYGQFYEENLTVVQIVMKLRNQCPCTTFYEVLEQMTQIPNIRNFLLVTFSDRYLPQIGFNDRMIIYNQAQKIAEFWKNKDYIHSDITAELLRTMDLENALGDAFLRHRIDYIVRSTAKITVERFCLRNADV